MKQACTDRNGFCQIVKNLCKTILLCLVLCKYPRCCLINVFVAAAEQRKYFRDCICHTKFLHLLCNAVSCSCYNCLKICVCFSGNACGLYKAIKIFIAHGNGTVYQISQNICKIGIVSLDYKIPCDDTIILEWHLMKYEVTCRIHTKQVYHIVCINYVSFGLAHLVTALQEPWMTKYLLRKRKIKCHKEYRPVNRVETYDILTDEM